MVINNFMKIIYIYGIHITVPTSYICLDILINWSYVPVSAVRVFAVLSVLVIH